MSLSTPISLHRVNKAPLDDSEVFDNMIDLMKYCNSGPCYDGQVVSVKMYDNYNLELLDYTGSGTPQINFTKVQRYMIFNNTPVLLMNNDYVIKNYKNRDYLMVLDHNNFIEEYDATIFTYTNFNKYIYSLLNELSIFAWMESEYEFILVNRSGDVVCNFKQNFDPVTGYIKYNETEKTYQNIYGEYTHIDLDSSKNVVMYNKYTDKEILPHYNAYSIGGVYSLYVKADYYLLKVGGIIGNI